MSTRSAQLVVRPTLAACAAGVLLGVTYTLSPVTVWFALAMIPLFVWAGRDISGRERLWLFRLLAAALVLRVLALVVFFLWTYRVDGSFAVLIPDEPYVEHNALWIRNITLGIPVAPSDYKSAFDAYGESGLTYLFAFIQLQLGSAPYGIRLVNIVVYLAATVIIYRMVRPTFGALASLAGLAVVLFLPSLFVWSISALKEPGYLLFMAISLYAVSRALQATALRTRVFAVIACVLALLGAGTMRQGTTLIVGGGMLAGLFFATVVRRLALLGMATLVVVLLCALTLLNPRVQNQALSLLQRASIYHVGHIKSGGWGYKVLDDDLYARPDIYTYRMTGAASARYALRAAASLVLVPLPWNAASPSAVAYLSEQVVWYVLVVLAIVGSAAGLRIDVRLTGLLLGVIALSAIAIALMSGNVGTMVRHRGMVMMPLAWLSGLGATSIMMWVAARRPVTNQPLTTVRT